MMDAAELRWLQIRRCLWKFSHRKWKVRRHKHLGGFGDAGIIVCCMKLQEQQQADVNYFCVRGSVYTETYTFQKKTLFKLVL